MAIQQVTAMSKESFEAPFGQSSRAGMSAREAEYNAVYEAVTATERGRWFLAEFANRNRKADSDLILASLARIEVAIAAGAVPLQAAPQTAAPATMPSAEASVAVPAELTRALGGERDEEVADAPARVSAEAPAGAVVEDEPVADFSAHIASPSAAGLPRKVLSDEDYSDAVAAIAASLTTRLGESAKDPGEHQNSGEDAAAQEPQPEPPNVLTGNVIAAADAVKPDAAPMPQDRLRQDNSPRWYIEGPDFVFDKAAGEPALLSSEPPEPPPGSAQKHAQLLGAELMSSRPESLPAIREEAARLAAVETAVEVAAARSAMESAALESTAIEPAAQHEAQAAPLPPPALEIVPLTDLSRPALRIAREAAPAPQRAPRFGSLTVTDALSEDEVIALFG